MKSLPSFEVQPSKTNRNSMAKFKEGKVFSKQDEELLGKLKEWDTDQSGSFSTVEVFEAAKQYAAQVQNAENEKKMRKVWCSVAIIGVFAAIVLCGIMFALMIVSIETTKEMRATGSSMTADGDNLVETVNPTQEIGLELLPFMDVHLLSTMIGNAIMYKKGNYTVYDVVEAVEKPDPESEQFKDKVEQYEARLKTSYGGTLVIKPGKYSMTIEGQTFALCGALSCSKLRLSLEDDLKKEMEAKLGAAAAGKLEEMVGADGSRRLAASCSFAADLMEADREYAIFQGEVQSVSPPLEYNDCAGTSNSEFVCSGESKAVKWKKDLKGGFSIGMRMKISMGRSNNDEAALLQFWNEAYGFSAHQICLSCYNSGKKFATKGIYWGGSSAFTFPTAITDPGNPIKYTYANLEIVREDDEDTVSVYVDNELVMEGLILNWVPDAVGVKPMKDTISIDQFSIKTSAVDNANLASPDAKDIFADLGVSSMTVRIEAAATGKRSTAKVCQKGMGNRDQYWLDHSQSSTHLEKGDSTLELHEATNVGNNQFELKTLRSWGCDETAEDGLQATTPGDQYWCYSVVCGYVGWVGLADENTEPSYWVRGTESKYKAFEFYDALDGTKGQYIMKGANRPSWFGEGVYFNPNTGNFGSDPTTINVILACSLSYDSAGVPADFYASHITAIDVQMSSGSSTSANCRDGSTGSSASLCETDTESDPWITIDLGEEKSLQDVYIHNAIPTDALKTGCSYGKSQCESEATANGKKWYGEFNGWGTGCYCSDSGGWKDWCFYGSQDGLEITSESQLKLYYDFVSRLANTWDCEVTVSPTKDLAGFRLYLHNEPVDGDYSVKATKKRCKGSALSQATVSSKDECAQQCKDTDGCTHFGLWWSALNCKLYSTCSETITIGSSNTLYELRTSTVDAMDSFYSTDDYYAVYQNERCTNTNTLQTISSVTAAECSISCYGEDTCSYFRFEDDGTGVGVCKLYAKCLSTTTQSGGIVYKLRRSYMDIRIDKVGCADGTAEGLEDMKFVRACSGSFSTAGLKNTGADSADALCASGWSVCSSIEQLEKGGLTDSSKGYCSLLSGFYATAIAKPTSLNWCTGYTTESTLCSG